MLKAVPLELAESKEFVEKYHRHHGAVHRDKFRVGCSEGGGACRSSECWTACRKSIM